MSEINRWPLNRNYSRRETQIAELLDELLRDPEMRREQARRAA